jgi:hypothetical protein
MPELTNLNDLLPLLVPAAILQLILLLVALIHLIRHKKTKNLNVWAWGAIILFVNIVGPILYLTVGRGEE